MAAELQTLQILLLLAMMSAPLATSRFFLETSRLQDASHVMALALAGSALLLDLPALAIAWPLFCALHFTLFFRLHGSALRSPYQLCKVVPLLFSFIGATWLVGGLNDLEILGYDPAFSYYAALHAHVLGWTMLACLALLANRAERFRGFFLVAVWLCLGSFLLIAFGIDGMPRLKPFGVLGLTVAIVVSQLLFVFLARKKGALVLLLSLASLGGFLLTMTLAWQNELGALRLGWFFGVRPMVSVHGIVNVVIVAPCLALALYFAYLRESVAKDKDS